MADLSEDGTIQPNEVIKYSSPGYLWIYFQYIDQGYIDAIETDLIKKVKDRDFHGALFENTRLVLDRLMSLSEHERVIRVYQAAIKHRLKALKEEHAISINSKKKVESQNASKKWVKHYLPPFRKLVLEYEAQLSAIEQIDVDLDGYRSTIQIISKSLGWKT